MCKAITEYISVPMDALTFRETSSPITSAGPVGRVTRSNMLCHMLSTLGRVILAFQQQGEILCTTRSIGARIGSQLCYIAEGLNLFLPPALVPSHQINDINKCHSCSLFPALARILSNFVIRSPTSSHESHFWKRVDTNYARSLIARAEKKIKVFGG